MSWTYASFLFAANLWGLALTPRIARGKDLMNMNEIPLPSNARHRDDGMDLPTIEIGLKVPL
ncbi:MAG: hypothetical protein A3F17_07525 [Gammaproteobacteria bacterium RIFCSPHIGHO2_12_FULL_41_15]|nr:MAG: hypothetical protein A3F17_07525 [Gammaproteobacteria bacterium RIFCSPHIGHO2_12_FULL_41_15]